MNLAQMAQAQLESSASSPSAERSANGANVRREVAERAERIAVPFSLAAVDPDGAANARREYKIQFISAGRVLRRDGQEADWEIPAETIIAALQAGLFENLACFIDHAEVWDNSSLRNLCGVSYAAKWDAVAQAAVGTLRLYDNAAGDVARDIFDQIMADQAAGDPVPNVGGSLVFYARHDYIDIGESPGEEYLRVTTEFAYIESWDIVFGPGRDGRVLDILSRLGAARPQLEDGGSEMKKCQICGQPIEDGVAHTCEGQEVSGGNAGASEASPQPASIDAQVDQFVELALARLRLNAATAGASPQPASGAGSSLAAFEQKLDRVLGALGQREDGNVVEGLGVAPLNPRNRISGQAPIDEFAGAVDWLFGAPGAKLPNPQLRSSKFLYEALTGDYDWRDVFDSERALLATANPTTLPGLAVDSMNKVIVSLWDGLAMYRWFEQIVMVQPNDGSLHDIDWIQFGGIGNLPVVADGASYTELDVADSKESDSPVKHGGYVGVTRKMLRNSEIARIQAVPRALAVAAVRTRSANIAGIFTSESGVGPTLDQDSTALFHSDHGNVATTAFSFAAWKAARLECYKQTELGSGKRQGLWPKYWLGPADLYDDALNFFGFGSGPGGKPGVGDNDLNPYAQTRPGDPRPIPLSVPEFTDANDWAYIADPALAPVIQMSYSFSPGGRSHPIPELFSVVSETAGLMFSADTMPIKVRDEYWYGVATYRGIGKRNVT